jgi:hypothetical protein
VETIPGPGPAGSDTKPNLFQEVFGLEHH